MANKSKTEDSFEIAIAICLVILLAVYTIAAVYDWFNLPMDLIFLWTAVLTLFLSFYFGDIRKTRFYVEHYHIHHALLGIILLGIDVLLFSSNIILLGIVWGLLLSEAKFFVTERRKALRLDKARKVKP